MKRRINFSQAQVREAARYQREVQAAQRRWITDQERAARKQERMRTFAAKEARQRYVEERSEEVDDLNKDLQQKISELRNILGFMLRQQATNPFEALRVSSSFPPFQIPTDLQIPQPYNGSRKLDRRIR